MLQPLKLRQTGAYAAFRCIGPACEDNCCYDWSIPVDRRTYELYQTCGDEGLRPQLREFVTIRPAGDDEDFARINLVDNHCPLLSDGLCSVHASLGEAFLSDACASFPRAAAIVDGVQENSLFLSCPEAARLVLLDPARNPVSEHPAETPPARLADYAPVLDSTPYPHFAQVREVVQQILRANQLPRWRRMAILARFCEDLNATLAGRGEPAADRIRAAREALTGQPAPLPEPPAARLEILLELVVGRLSMEFTPKRFLECYREFMEGLDWGPLSTIEEIAGRHRVAEQDFARFEARYPQFLDNFLISYATRTVFPYGRRDHDPQAGQKIRIDYAENAVREQYLLLAVHYSAVRTLLIGMSAFHNGNLTEDHAIKLVQSYAKAYLHSGTFAAQALQTLSSNGIRRAPEATILFQE